ncbi:MAG TPA: alpha/beta fold hydrolase [Candidatus Dormibacteraeota bacterium]|nr:alpha/beta fold hydrolase [Candidatus Dormibacteraeota bacterium]
MARLKANGVDIEYEVQGDPSSAPLLLIMGLGAQLTTWDDGFVDELVKRGFYVIRYDNRDSGLSTKMESAGPADIAAAYSGNAHPAYTLDDLADDAAGVLDALGIPAAHIVGASMGGFIAQLVAINHPERTLSLTSIMSGPGGHDAIPPTPEAQALLVRAPGATRDEIIAMGIESRRVLAGVNNPFDIASERAKTERLYDRSYYPLGFGRQLVAILAAQSRIPALHEVKAPTLVVHGADDPLVPPENGRRVAAAVPGARYLEFAGAGHNLPPSTWSAVADAIAETARQASPAARS